jgi:uncharacterized protein YqgV (UPF0045/DUF77 family)
MKITVEISYYPLHGDFNTKIMNFLEQLTNQQQVQVEIGQMSTLLQGEYDQVMHLINTHLAKAFTQENAVFNLKISNSCEWTYQK